MMVKRRDLEERREFWKALPQLFQLKIENGGISASSCRHLQSLRADYQ